MLVECKIPGCKEKLNEDELADHMLAHSLSQDTEDPSWCSGQGCSSADSTTSDRMLAIYLQQEQEDLISRHRISQDRITMDMDFARRLHNEEANKLEKQEFEKLQEQYGMRSNGGFSKQFEEKMQRSVGKTVKISEYFKRKTNLHATMITGNDSNETRTTGVIQILSGVYEHGIKEITAFHLCTETDHYSADISDRGWGCGYRNLQMLLSALLKVSPYKEVLKNAFESSCIPSIPKLQELIEKAWKDGYDVNGSEQLRAKLTRTKKWIGATEIAAVLRWLSVRARLVDFHEPAADGTHPILFEWIENYFITNKTCAAKHSFPLYLQHHGHSRLCIGVEFHQKNYRNLLLFDPSHTVRQMRTLQNIRLPFNMSDVKFLRKTLKQMKQKQFQLVFIDGLYETHEEKQESKILRSIRIGAL